MSLFLINKKKKKYIYSNMGDLRSCSTISSGTKRKCEHSNFIKKQKLLNNNVKINNIIDIKNFINKAKRRSISLSTNFPSMNDFSTCENYLNLKNENKIDENLRDQENNLKEKKYFSNIQKRYNKRTSKYLTKNYFNLKTFKKFLFKKSLLYKIRCLNHNSIWLSELSKSKMGNINNELFCNTEFIQPFPFYKKAIDLFYEKKYKDAYVLLSGVSTYCSSSFSEHKILNDNFFEKKSYNLQYMLNTLYIDKHNKLYEKNYMKKNLKTKILMKNVNDFSVINTDKNKKFLFNSIIEEKNEVINNSIFKSNSTFKYIKSKCCNNIKKKKKKVINYKFVNYENYINNICNIFLQNNYLPNFSKKKKKKIQYVKYINYSHNRDKKLIKKDSNNVKYNSNMNSKEKTSSNKELIFDIIKEKNMNHRKRSINYNSEENKKKYEVEYYLQDCDDKYSQKKNKNVSINDRNYIQKLEREYNEKIDSCHNNMTSKKKRMNIMHNEKNIHKKEIKNETEEDIRLFIFIKILCLYLYSNTFYQNNKKKKDITHDFNSENSYDEKNMNYLNGNFNIGNMKRKEILIYIAKHLRKIKKKIEFDTYLYLLLSVVCYDLKKFNKSLLYVKKSIKKDYFNFVSWVFFNNLISIEIFVFDNSNITTKFDSKNKLKFTKNYKNKNSKKKISLKKNIFIKNSKKLKKLYLYLFENEFFFNTKSNYTNVMRNYNSYIYINPLKNLKESFFFKNNYFKSNIFNKKTVKKKKKKVNHSFFSKYKNYIKRYNFKNNFMTLFGYAHFCSLNTILYKNAIDAYKFLNKMLKNNLYISSELAKLYYYCGNYYKSIKYFNQIQKISRKNKILKKDVFHKYCISYFLKKNKNEVHIEKKKDQDIFQYMMNCNDKNIMVINQKDYKNVKNLLLPMYFSKKFIYLEILVNIYFLQKKIPDLLILIYNYPKKKKKKNYDEKYFYMLGKYFSLNNNHHKSIYYFKKSIKIDKFHLYSYVSLAQEYLLFNNINSSVYILIRVIILYFNNSNAWFSLAKCLEYKKNYPFSIFSYKNAIYFQRNIALYYFLANIYLKKGDIKNYIETLKNGWMFKRSILFSSKLFLIYLKILKKEKRQISYSFNEKKNMYHLRKNIKQKYYKKYNDCFIWCIKYLKSYFKKFNKNRIYYPKVNLRNSIEYNYSNNSIIEDFILFGYLKNEEQIVHLNKLFLKSFNSLHNKNTSYLYFICLLRNSNKTLLNAIFYLANYFFFNRSFHNSLKLYKILWDVGGIYSEESFKLFRFTKQILQRKKEKKRIHNK
ncbi:conserved Plasmodium protein, unknown function [Plasmodium relictum]|uniref:Tetratricopeptide repeat protein n=1 Tax=Plasmodium relictum TaxID=85471 RepID=A0A1J1HE76_PLARL|nr:conserved Plasmodium protein, unknown function [Plasmodium relictum]CRH04103.1 conserved Plasmodium protein, unknown function [Plasmodium relictum]